MTGQARTERAARDAEFTNRIREITRAGRKVSNTVQGELSEAFIEEKVRGKSSEEKAAIIDRWEKIFQQWRKVEQVVVPYVPELFEMAVEGELRIYKGVSYNPMIPAYGENFNILDFFGWLKAGDFKGIVIDASLYGIVNAAQTLPVGTYSERASAEAAQFLKDGIPRYPEIRKSADVRSRYLRATAVSMFPPGKQPLVVDAEMLWASKLYLGCLQEAINFCAGNPVPGGALEIARYANYTRYNTPYQRWYSVLVLAEALYLYEAYGVNVKLGPTTESNFDSLIREFMRGRGIRYGFVWYDRGVEKEIPYPEFLAFGDDAKMVGEKLKNKKLESWIMEIIAPFLEDGKGLQGQVADTIRRISDAASRDIPKLPAEGEWFVIFPPGACD